MVVPSVAKFLQTRVDDTEKDVTYAKQIDFVIDIEFTVFFKLDEAILILGSTTLQN